jgi:hypothetical protein
LIIDEFRANHGGTFEGTPLVLLHHRGAQTGLRHPSLRHLELDLSWQRVERRSDRRLHHEGFGKIVTRFDQLVPWNPSLVVSGL